MTTHDSDSDNPAFLRLPPGERDRVCRAFQDAVTETLVKKTADTARSLGLDRIAVGGGVSANGALRAEHDALLGMVNV